ncbi:hypothetical protein [Luteimonas sp. TWI414]
MLDPQPRSRSVDGAGIVPDPIAIAPAFGAPAAIFRNAEIETRVPLSEDERRAIPRGTDARGVVCMVGLAIAAVLAGCFFVLSLDWTDYVFILGIIALGVLVFGAIISVMNADVRRDLKAGQKAVITGTVEARVLTHIEQLAFHSVRIREPQGTRHVFAIHEAIYARLQADENVEVSCLPYSRILLSLRTRHVRWSLQDDARRRTA